ncbi:MAG: hypothetical protein ACK5U2_14570, partial [Microcystis sp.]
ENSCPLRNMTNYMGTLRKVKGVHPLMDKGFRLLWYICMGEVQLIEYLPITTDAMRKAALFWAQARQQGQPTAGDKTIDGDMI